MQKRECLMKHANKRIKNAKKKVNEVKSKKDRLMNKIYDLDDARDAERSSVLESAKENQQLQLVNDRLK